MTKEAVENLIQALALEPHKSLLEIGAGHLAVENVIRNFKIEGLDDTDKEMVNQALDEFSKVAGVAIALNAYIKKRYGG